MDEIRIWNTALTQSTIQRWMYKELDSTHPNYSSLVRYYKLNDGSIASNIARDSKGNNNASLVNFASTAAATNSTNTSGWIYSGNFLNSLIAYYPFNGNANDSSGYGNNGVAHGATLTNDRFGNANSAYLFNGSTSYIEALSSASLESPAYTKEVTQTAWIYLNRWYPVNGGSDGPIICKSNSGSNAFMYDMRVSPSILYSQYNNWGVNNVGGFSFNLNNWYFVATTYNGSIGKTYINGRLVGTTPLSTPIPLDNLSLHIGDDPPGGTEYFNGIIDEVKIYNRALSDSEIQQLYTPPCTGSALSFDGVDDYVSLDANAINQSGGLNQGTIETWAYFKSINQAPLLAKQKNGSNTYSVLSVGYTSGGDGSPQAGTPGKIYFHSKNNFPNAFSNSNIDTGKWYHIAITFNQSVAYIYINGILNSTTNGNFTIPDDITGIISRIGSWGGDGFGLMNGMIDEFRVWNMARTPQQILDGMYCDFPANTTGLILNYTMDTAQGGLKIKDKSLRQLDGTLGIAPANPTFICSAIATQDCSIKFPQRITYDSLYDRIFGDTAFHITATASSGLSVKFRIISGPATIDTSNNYITLIGAGTVTVEAYQSGDSIYSAASEIRSFEVLKADQRITFTAVLDTSFNDTRYILKAISSAGLYVSYDIAGYGVVTGNLLTFTGSGTVSVKAYNNGNQNYDTASAILSFCIPAPQPGAISGYTQLCPNVEKIYTIAAIPGSDIAWSVSGGIITPEPGTSTIVKIRWADTGYYTITVTDSAPCNPGHLLSSVLNVHVVNNIVPAPATNLFPDTGTLIYSFPFALSWKPSANTDFYDVYIWKDSSIMPTTPAIANIRQIATPVYPSEIPNLSPGKFDWKVVSKNGCGETGSVASSFNISELPNLVIDTVEAPLRAYPGTSIDVSARIHNIGRAGTQNAQWIDEVWLSLDNKLGNDDGDIYLGGNGNVRALAPNESYDNFFRVTIPYSAQNLKYFIIVKTNYYNSVGETNTLDNIGYDSLMVDSLIPLGLKVNSVIVNTTNPFSGQFIPVTYKVTNNGDTDLVNRAWRDYIYVSPDSNLDINNLSLATKIGYKNYYGTLRKDSSYIVSDSFPLPVRMFGRMYVYVVANAENSFPEFIADNIRHSASLNVTLTPPPDFIVSDIHVPDIVSGGQTITVDWYVKNQGASKPNRAETAWVDKIFLAKDSAGTTGIVPLGSSTPQPLPAMNIGESYHNALNVTIPQSTTDSAYIFVYTDANDNIFEYNKENNNTTRRKIKISNPDLVIDSIAIPDSAMAGTSIDVEYRLKNIGAIKSLLFSREDEITLTPNQVNFTSLGVYISSNSLDTGASILLRKTVVIPDDIPASIQKVVINADYTHHIAETNENNNSFASPPIKIIAAIYPDLVASNMQVSAGNLLTNKNYGFSYTVMNNGAADILGQSWNDIIYISSDATWQGNGVPLKTIPQYKTLLQGDSYIVSDSFSIDLPVLNNLDSGKFYIYVFANAGQSVGENGVQSNNTSRSSQMTVKHLPFPDLTVTNALTISSANSGSRIQVTYTVKNIGGTYGFSNQWLDGIYFSTDNAFGGDIFAAGKTIVTNLASDSSYTIRMYVTVPNGLSGNYYMLVVTDYNNQNKDQNRSNNYKVVSIQVGGGTTSGPIYVTLTPPADLAVKTFNVPTAGIAGQPVMVKWKVQNQAHVTNKLLWTDKIVLSTDEVVDGTDPVIYTHLHMGSLDSNAFYMDSALVFLPSGASGNYYLLIKTDANDLVYESNKFNNIASSFIFIIQPPPSDLIVTNIEVPPTAVLGDSATIKFMVKNIGTNPATGYNKFGIYFSLDSLFSSSDTLLYSQFSQVNIAPSGTDTFTQKIKLKGVNAGLQYAIARTDMLNNIPELNEQNNTDVSSHTINITVPELPLRVYVSDTLYNNDEMYYRIEVPDSLAGKAILVSIKGDSANGRNELYIRYGNIPTRYTYDYAYDRVVRGSQDVIIPDLKSGTYYLLAFGQTTLPVQQQDVTLYAAPIDFTITKVTADNGGNTGMVTVEMQGALFQNGMTAILKNDSLGTIVAQRVIFINSTSLFATFNLSGAKIGKYIPYLKKPGIDSVPYLPGFNVVAGTAGGVANNGTDIPGFFCHIRNAGADELLDMQVNYPPEVRTYHIFPMILSWGNAGNIDIPVTERILTCLENLPVTADASEMFTLLAQWLGGQAGEEIGSKLLEFSQPGLPDVIRPGYRASKVIFGVLPYDQTYTYRLIEK